MVKWKHWTRTCVFWDNIKIYSYSRSLKCLRRSSSKRTKSLTRKISTCWDICNVSVVNWGIDIYIPGFVPASTRGVPPTTGHPLPHISDIMFLIFPQHCNWPRAVRTTRKRSQFKSSQMENMENRSAGYHHTPPSLGSSFPKCSKLPQFDWQTDFLQEPVPIPVRVYWRWFWSPPRGHSSSHAICHLDCMVDSRGGVLWLLIVYRLRCFRLHKDHMHGARWWACTLIMSLYLCAGRSATIRSPRGTSLLSPTMLFFHKYSLLQLSLTSLITNTNSPPPRALLLQVHTNTLCRWEITSA